MINSKLLSELRKLNIVRGELLIPYKLLNDIADKQTPTDTSNIISRTLQSRNVKDKQEILEAIFKKDIFVDDKDDLYIKERDGNISKIDISFNRQVSNVEVKVKIKNKTTIIKFGTHETVEKTFRGSESHKQLINDITNAKEKNDLVSIKGTIENMLKER